MSKRFRRQDYFRYKKLGTKWRRPRGRQSKMRVSKGGAGDMPKIGYGTKASERGKIRGMQAVYVASIGDLEKAANSAIIISGRIGGKKRAEIAAEAKRIGLTIINASKAKRSMRAAAKKKAERELEEKMKKLKKKEAEKPAKAASKIEGESRKQDSSREVESGPENNELKGKMGGGEKK